jgi:sulfide:quinone oxidoreductase
MKAKVLVLGSGFAGHTAALHLSKLVRKEADITVISPGNRFTWFPSLVWVGNGTMAQESCHFELAPVYERIGVNYIAGRATAIYPDSRRVEVLGDDCKASSETYDFLLNATGPHLNFEGTPGLGPQTGNTHSICTVEHAVATWERYDEVVQALKKGSRQRIVIGTGHAMATCEGAAFEYLMNVDTDLRNRGLRQGVDLVWLSNEPEAGDFGVDGIEAMKGGSIVTGASLVRGLLDKHEIRAIFSAGVSKVEPGKLHYEEVGSDPATLEYDFAMLIPQFRGVSLKYLADDGSDLAPAMTQSNGFMNVDADYTPKTYENYTGQDWPSTYQSPKYDNIYAAGIAFAPPHALSKGKKTSSGMAVVATAPRTGMASGIMGRTVALNIVDQIHGEKPQHHERLSEMPSACIASMGKSLWNGSAAAIVMVPTARDFQRFPKYGRDISRSELEVGLAGAWTKRAMHSAFMWKLQARPGWSLIPE